MPLKVLEGMASRKRRPNWTDQECLLLAQLMQSRKDIIKGKCSSGVSIQDKRLAWEEITQAINTTFPQFQRTVSDCNKKWENLLAKCREEIKRQRRQAGTEEVSVEQFSTVTQVVISVMSLSEMLQHKSSIPESAETQQNSCDEDGNGHTAEGFIEKHVVTEVEIPTYPDPSTSLEEPKVFTDIPKPLALHFSSPRASCYSTSADLLHTPCSASPPVLNCTTLQERTDLEMSVLRRQESVLKLQEEYYSLKIKLMKKQLEEPLSKD